MAQDADKRGPAERRLNGWKEIASYLGKSVRTVQRWERDMEMPVRRLEGPKGEIIFALASELDDWRLSRTKKLSFDAAQPEPEDEREAPPSPEPLIKAGRPSLSLWMSRLGFPNAALLTVICLLIISASAMFWGRPILFQAPQPASLHVDQNALIASDAQGHVLWQHAFPVGLNEAAYKVSGREMWIGDLNGDGKTEVLFAYHPADETPATSVLYCFASDGRELWHFTPGKKVRTATETFEPPFGIQSFKTVVTPKRGYVVVSSAHHTYYPAQIAVLSSRDGRLISEYWHSGHLNFVTVGDLNHDGNFKIYASGIDNERKIATLVVLGLEDANGASHQETAQYQLLDLPLASERARVYFPRSCVNRTYFPFNVATLVVLQEQGITVQVNEQGLTPGGSTIEYLLSPDLKLLSISPHDSFSANHKMMELQGLLKHPFSDNEIDTLANEYRNQTSLAAASVSGLGQSGQHLAHNSVHHHR